LTLPNAYDDYSETFEVEFPDGPIFVLKKRYDARTDEALANDMFLMKAMQGGGAGTAGGLETRVNMGELKRLQLMTVRITLADGRVLTPPIGMKAFNELSRGARTYLADRLDEYNPPTARLRETWTPEPNQDQEPY